MNLPQQLKSAGLDIFPCRADKAPAVNRGESWKEVAKQDPSSLYWPTGIVGVPIPTGVVVLDLDTYKGVTREQAEQYLGCKLPWDKALIQSTLQGGQHYAFRCDWNVRQMQDGDLRGLDTRASGKGYIATGDGYTPYGMGVFTLAYPDCLPVLPYHTKNKLEARQDRTTPVELPTGDRDIDVIRAALRHVDPRCTRAEWVHIGLALRHHFHDDPYSGYSLYDQWSRGDLLPVPEVPVNYEPDTLEAQFNSFKVEGGMTIGTLFHKAITNGWNPPTNINVAMAFGPGSASGEDFSNLVDKIIEQGGDPKQTNELMQEVISLTCNPLQREMLKATLVRELKEAGLFSKALAEQLRGSAPRREQGQYDKNHTENALTFIKSEYPDNTLARCNKTWFSYNGMAWEEMSDDDISCVVTMAMQHSYPQNSTIEGTVKIMEKLCNRRGAVINQLAGNLIILQNGVLDLTTGVMLAHDKMHFSTNLLPYNYNPNAVCPEWEKFLLTVMSGDRERMELLQEWFGYLMTNQYDHQKIMLLLGPKRCGKGTIGRMINLLVGDINFAGGEIASLVEPDFIETLQTKTVMFDGDCQKKFAGGVSEKITQKLKTISGNDKIFIKRKWKDGLTSRLPTRITISANHIPRLFDDSGALAGRLLVIPFDVSFYGREDLTLFDRLRAEIEGIALWALHGLTRLQRNGRFTAPSASAVEVEQIEETYSPLSRFVHQCLKIGGDEVIGGTELYAAYKAWALQHDEDDIMPRRVFSSNFRDFTRGKGCWYGVYRIDGYDNPTRGFKGVKVKTEAVATVSDRAFKVVK